MVHSLRRDMFLAKKGTKNQLPLAREFQLMFGQMVFQGFHLSRIFARCHDQPPGVVIKTQSFRPVKRWTRRRPAESNLTAFSAAVYSPLSDEPPDMRQIPDAQA